MGGRGGSLRGGQFEMNESRSIPSDNWDNEETVELTDEEFVRLLKKLPSDPDVQAGYDASDPDEIYKLVAPKKWQDYKRWENVSRRMSFKRQFNEKKYGFSDLTNGKVTYVGTNDLDALLVKPSKRRQK